MYKKEGRPRPLPSSLPTPAPMIQCQQCVCLGLYSCSGHSVMASGDAVPWPTGLINIVPQRTHWPIRAGGSGIPS